MITHDISTRPTTPPPTLASLQNAPQEHLPKPSRVRTTCVNASNHAKLEGILSQDLWVMLYDTYYGRKPLFYSDVLSQADNIKLGAVGR